MKWSTNKAKEYFTLEVMNIEDEKLQTACIAMITKIPSYFWTIPASSSGKYHPECDLDDGGLVRHSLMVCRCAMDLVTSEMFVRDTAANRDIARVAALFHDCIKNGPITTDENGKVSYDSHTDFVHPRYASDFVRENLTKFGIDELKVNMISDAIYTHMGKWCTNKYGNDKALSKPRTDFEKMIHIADYTASRKYISGLEEWKE